MDKSELESYVKAGKIAAEVCRKVEALLKPGARLVEIADSAEAEIARLGGKPAFPLNISINEAAAHFTPQYNDEKTIGESDLVKIDVGVHVDGYIGDTAFTWCAKNDKLIAASRAVLEAAIAVVRPGVTVSEISNAICGKTEDLGVGLIVNLSGHTLDQYVFHGAPSIPNTRNDNSHAFKDGDVIAIEPFVLESNGTVRDSTPVEIYRHVFDKPIRLPEARKVLELARDRFGGLPFAKRWLIREGISPLKASLALTQLESVGAIESYPVLRESRGRRIAQSEHTIILGEKPLITTKIGDD
jgi:methionyl aminopeptidase